ncbi:MULTISPECIES: D-alanyl-D-alanine carboxypeptidase family protein [unclassified Exiguobacterium]|nr:MULTISPECIES: D-alanyl-D-alanine carboxypeptidase family protein [unclassified Exiguobacterium]TCI42154.1 D-alanyl-D-alanine carboxypeptidase [Exiguobacterium sp. SH5S32]TCI49498.1 D-alanyl-D-alanine carboxypeptidase [Exiguobacterium sp. SH1S4]TCI58880.1 D-alanyl-D-alanine carboxypeptidase [Exiguobacterium sp. SH3S1]TCI66864.1 D-alanyl-D-alanine carboxypeptidase [Exiguobacterium sp. SH1S1]
MNASAAPKVEASGAMLVDMTTGQVLFSKDEDAMLPPASITKLMTTFLVREAVESGELSWNEEVTPSEAALALTRKPGLARIPLVNKPYTVKELYDVALIRSANEAAVTLSEAVAGSEEAFVQQMNERATELGMTQTTFANVSGLDSVSAGRPGENLTSANDLMRLALAYLTKFPDVLDVTKRAYVDIDGVRFEATNRMLSGRDLAYPGMLGFKTGTTDDAGYCFIGVSTRDGRTVLSVVLGAETDNGRYEATKALHEFAYRDFVMTPILRTGEIVPENVFVAEGEVETVAARTTAAFEVLVEKGQAVPEPVYDLPDTKAPVAVDQQVGTVTIEPSESVRYLDGESPPTGTLVTAESVETASFLTRMSRAFADFLEEVRLVLGKLSLVDRVEML